MLIATIDAEIRKERELGTLCVSQFNVGTFEGKPQLMWLGPRSYFYTPSLPIPFAFIRSNGQRIVPLEMLTDAGTIPRFAWSLPDLDPWHFLPAYVLHDWCFVAHHRGMDVLDFAETAMVLAEAVKTLIDTGTASGNWLTVEVLYRAVCSSRARALWDYQPEAVTA